MDRKWILALALAWVAVSGTLFTAMPARAGLPGSSNCPSSPGGVCQWTVSLDANNVCTVNSATPTCTDTSVQTSAINMHSFLIGAVVNASGGVAPTAPTCGQQCISGLFGWQFEIIYDNTSFVPQADPILGSAADVAGPTVVFGGQTTTGNPNWNGMRNSGTAFGSSVILPVDATHERIRVFLSLLAPSPPVNLFPQITSTHTLTGNLLGNVAFETKKIVTNAQFNITGVKFVNINGDEIKNSAGAPAVIAGPPITETVTNNPPAAKFTATQIPSGDVSCTPITGAACSAFAWKLDATASSDSDGTIANPAGYFWDFGDGSQDNANIGAACTLVNCNQGNIAIHDYGATGSFTASLRVLDDKGATGAARDPLGNVIVNSQPSHSALKLGPNAPPIASFTFQASAINPQVIIFNASNSSDPDGTIVAYNWVFGDGGTNSTSHTLTMHSYSQTGSFNVTLTVIDNANLTGSASHNVSVQLTDEAPIARFVFFGPTNSSTIQFDASNSTDPDGTILSYQWMFGDGFNITTTSPFIVHAYHFSSNYTVTLTVVDSSNLTDSVSHIVSAIVQQRNDLPPVAVFSVSSFNATTGQTVFFFGGGSFDPDGFIQSWYWNFGDGYTGFGSQTLRSYSSPGNYVVTLTVTDNAGLTASTTGTISVRADIPPIASFTFSPTNPAVGQTVFFDGSASQDPDGFIQSWVWSFGETFGNLTSFGPQTQHVFNAPGNYTVTLQVFDNNGKSAVTDMIVPVHPKPLHDVAIISVNAYPPKVVSSQDVGIQVILTNNGSNNETVSVTAYYNSKVIETITGVSIPAQCNFCFNNVYVQITWDTTGVPAGNYTISATVFLPTDQNPSDNTKTDGQVQVLPPPVLTVSPASGAPGTTVVVHGSNFPPSPYYSGIGFVEVTFDDQLIGFTNAHDGAFNFTFSIPLSQQGPHLIKALDEYSGAHASTMFQVLATPGPANLSVTVQVGTIYFPSDTAVIYSQVTLNGQSTSPSTFQVQLFLPNGSAIVLTTQSLGPGLYKSTFLVPKSGSIGTYLIIGRAHTNAPLDATGIASFEVKQTWLNSNSPKIAAGVTGAALFGLVVVAWQKGYFRRKEEEPPQL